MSASNNRRKHKTLTLSEKMEVLNRLDKGETIYKLAQEYDVGRATLHGIKMKKSQIVEHLKTMKIGADKRKTLKFGRSPMMENALYKWFLEQRANNLVISGDMIKTKAVELHKKLSENNKFRASDGWLDKFKKRFGIRLSTISKVKSPATDESVKSTCQDESDTIVKYDENIEQTEQVMMVDTIINDVLEIKAEKDSFEPCHRNESSSITSEEALLCFSKCILWSEENGISTQDITTLRKLREEALNQVIVNNKYN